ncbi:MAG TPA: hypothetical protein VF158_15855 [Longimicrobiales bacterium]
MHRRGGSFFSPPPDAGGGASGAGDEADAGLDDLIAEYAATYGGPPAPDTPLPIFWALASRIPRFEARAILRTIRGVAAGAVEAFGETSFDATLARDELERLAYPTRRARPRFALEQPPAPQAETTDQDAR